MGIRLKRYLEIERYRRPDATEVGLKLSVLRNLRHNPNYYEQYTGKGMLGDKKNQTFSLANPEVIASPHETPTHKNTPRSQAVREERAAKAKLVSLPLNMKGAKCDNCQAYRPDDPPNSPAGYCTNPEIRMKVYSDQHCKHWHNLEAKLAREDKV